jgi:hypothetical protein
MLFRLESHVRLLPVHEGDTLHLRIGGDHDISVHFLKEFYDVGEPGYEVAYLNVTAQGGWELDSNAEMFFQYLANDELPPDEEPPFYWVKAERENFGGIKTSRSLGKMPGPGFVPPLNILPVSIQSMISTVRKELAEGSRHAVTLVQWRFGILGLHEPLQSSLLQWSLRACFKTSS